MKILAKTHKGTEFVYSARSAHAVSERSAGKILEIINAHNYRINPEKNETWHAYEIDQYSPAYYAAQDQRFTIRNGIVKARTLPGC